MRLKRNELRVIDAASEPPFILDREGYIAEVVAARWSLHVLNPVAPLARVTHIASDSAGCVVAVEPTQLYVFRPGEPSPSVIDIPGGYSKCHGVAVGRGGVIYIIMSMASDTTQPYLVKVAGHGRDAPPSPDVGQGIRIHAVAQRTPEWHALRATRVTGSTMANVLGFGLGYSSPGEMLVEAFTGATKEVNHHMRRGIKLEPQATEAYIAATGMPLRTDIGFITRDDLPEFGASPDGIVFSQDGRIMLGVECKAPSPERGIPREVPISHVIQMLVCAYVCGLASWDYVCICDDRVTCRRMRIHGYGPAVLRALCDRWFLPHARQYLAALASRSIHYTLPEDGMHPLDIEREIREHVSFFPLFEI